MMSIIPSFITDAMAALVSSAQMNSSSELSLVRHSNHSSATSSDSEGEKLSTFKYKGIRDIIASFLHRCKIPYPIVPFDREFYDLCCDEAVRLNIPMEGPLSLKPHMRGGVAMARTAYRHLPDIDAQVYVALYTAFLIYTDDVFHTDVDAVLHFNNRFVRGEPQADAAMDSFAELLHQIPKRYGRVVANMMITSTLNLVTALLLENETQGMPLSKRAYGYPYFSRVMSGASEAYALFIFPPDLPLQSYIQALPEMMLYINNGNDILSFYKEESDGETVNRVSWLAECRDVEKEEALRSLVDDAVAAHEKVLQILSPDRRAHDAFMAFSHGYVGFHSGAGRYRLEDLDL